MTPVITKSKQRSLEVVSERDIPIYNAGERCGPLPRSYIAVSSTEIQRNTWKKNLLWILVHLHATEKQNVCGWTGFNILVRDEIEVKKDNIHVGYLPTIDAPATNMSTVFEILNQSLKIKDTLKLQATYVVVVFDQVLSAKAAEIKWKLTDRFRSIVLRMGAFHTICTFLGIIGKRFQDVRLKDICIESGVITKGSVCGVLEGWGYSRSSLNGHYRKRTVLLTAALFETPIQTVYFYILVSGQSRNSRGHFQRLDFFFVLKLPQADTRQPLYSILLLSINYFTLPFVTIILQ